MSYDQKTVQSSALGIESRGHMCLCSVFQCHKFPTGDCLLMNEEVRIVEGRF